ncbi:MAG: transposase [Aphanizomenon gracile PMC627.10]|nr:transposase [Aphanizomenon gracile PMC627.10]
MPNALMPLIYYLNSRQGINTDINFIDSTSIPSCHPKRARRNKVLKDLAGWGKSSICWYFGFKLHLIIKRVFEKLEVEKKSSQGIICKY